MTVDLDDFERRYRHDVDPWEFETSPYEQAKYATTVGWIGERQYRRCFEPGCSIGVLTSMLAARVGSVIACESSATAVRIARRRLGTQRHVELVHAAIPAWWPAGTFDLVVFSELGYYWDRARLHDLALRLTTALQPGAVMTAVHWLGSSPDHLLTGEEVHDVLADVLGPSAAQAHIAPLGDTSPDRRRTFLIERWERP